MFYLFAFCIGVLLAIQAPINASLGKALFGTPLIAALISFAVGTLCLFLIACYQGNLNANMLKAITQQSWWKFIGGILGACVVFGTILLAPKIGLANMFLLVILGQILSSVFLDSIGAFGLQVKNISLEKIIGILVILIGLGIFFYKDIRG